MTRETQINNLATVIATECKSIRTLVNGNLADLTGLSTTAKTNIVAALNEVKGVADAAASGGASVDDASTGTSTVWSSSKIAAEIAVAKQAAKDELIDGAGAANDTLVELSTQIQANDTDLVAILSNQSKRVAVDSVQTFTAPEKLQGLANLGAASATDLGDPNADFVAIFQAALV